MAPCWNGHREARAISAQNARNNGSKRVNYKCDCAIAIFNGAFAPNYFMIAIIIRLCTRKKRRSVKIFCDYKDVAMSIWNYYSYNSIVITVTLNRLLPQARVRITAVIVLLLCNWCSCYSLGQILYYYQLITHFNPCTISRAATVLLLVLVWPISTGYYSCYYWPYSYK